MLFTLLVVRTGNMERLVAFYKMLGLSWEYHQHGGSPFHYSTKIGEMVLEIYPLAKTQTAADKNLRLGFRLTNFEDAIQDLQSNNTDFFSGPKETEFGFSAVAVDPDGRKVELYKA